MDVQSTHDYLENLLKLAIELGSDSSEIHLSKSDGREIFVREGLVEKLLSHDQSALTMRIFVGKRSASFHSTQLPFEKLSDSITQAIEAAKTLPADDSLGLAEPSKMAWNYDRTGRLAHHPFVLSDADLAHMAKKLELKALGEDTRLSPGDGVNMTHGETHQFYANTHQFYANRKTTGYSISLNVKAQSDSDAQEGAAWVRSRTPQAYENYLSLAPKAAKEATEALDAITPKTEVTTLILTTEAAQELYSLFVSLNSGGLLVNRASFLCGMLGKKVFPSSISITEVPKLPDAWGSKTYDRDGIACELAHRVYQGKLETHFLSVYSARKLRMESTGNAGGVSNLLFLDKRGVGADVNSFIGSTKNGILVTDWLGSGANLLTGDFSQGAKGFKVENGKITKAVQGFTVAGNLQDFFKNMLIASDVDDRFSLLGGSVLLPKVQIAGL